MERVYRRASQTVSDTRANPGKAGQGHLLRYSLHAFAGRRKDMCHAIEICTVSLRLALWYLRRTKLPLSSLR